MNFKCSKFPLETRHSRLTAIKTQDFNCRISHDEKLSNFIINCGKVLRRLRLHNEYKKLTRNGNVQNNSHRRRNGCYFHKVLLQHFFIFFAAHAKLRFFYGGCQRNRSMNHTLAFHSRYSRFSFTSCTSLGFRVHALHSQQSFSF